MGGIDENSLFLQENKVQHRVKFLLQLHTFVEEDKLRFPSQGSWLYAIPKPNFCQWPRDPFPSLIVSSNSFCTDPIPFPYWILCGSVGLQQIPPKNKGFVASRPKTENGGSQTWLRNRHFVSRIYLTTCMICEVCHALSHGVVSRI